MGNWVPESIPETELCPSVIISGERVVVVVVVVPHKILRS